MLDGPADHGHDFEREPPGIIGPLQAGAGTTEGLGTRHQIAPRPPQLMSDATRLGDASETRVRMADAGEGSAAVTGSIVILLRVQRTK